MGTTYESNTAVSIVMEDGYKYEISKDADGCVSVRYLEIEANGKLHLKDTYCLGMAQDALLIAKGITEVANSMLKQE